MARHDVAAAITHAVAWRPAAFDQTDPLNYRLAWLPRNDAGNAERLLSRFGNDLLYVQDIGWAWWDGRRWSLEMGYTMANRLAHETVRHIYDEVQALQDAIGDKEVRDIQEIETHFKWAGASGNAQRINAMINICQHYCVRRPSDLDANPMLLNVANGTLELDDPILSGASRPRRSHLITKVIEVDYDPDATCPNFLRFMEDILPDPEVRLFLQRSFGYALTGLIDEQVLWFFYGTGANGKSTLVNIMARMLGSYCMSLPFSSLVLDERKRGESASPDLARLPGARMVRASEPEKGVKFSESTIKSITGGEPLTVRHLNQGFFEFTPSFKLFLSGNHKPVIRGQDHGVWRRINLVPFTVSIARDKRDPGLENKLWEERSGILNWLLDGLRMWRRSGLCPPEAVVAATREYREDSDPLGLFLNAWTEAHEAGSVQGKRLFDAYALWCRGNAVEPMSNTLFGRMLGERGLQKDRCGIITYRGIQLRQDALDALDEADRKRIARSPRDEDR
ncbi:hypothetical protein HEQ72_07625 [Haematospirillum sp. 15-248]|uniref:DNA primase family protein n=1 Tax=Haematospirillum sp. 15-248 TaxID=2723107 RepID=UPI00143A951C|nr:phage/plasmid primase, P4 family [Haematospirillum sp. 15-248]NKD88178.1 hypothetical protein [Haematospirillum sp. 15-248]